MPQIQYSEKYYDDVYEYRYAPRAARRARAAPRRKSTETKRTL
jgi:hypothetical protein